VTNTGIKYITEQTDGYFHVQVGGDVRRGGFATRVKGLDRAIQRLNEHLAGTPARDAFDVFVDRMRDDAVDLGPRSHPRKGGYVQGHQRRELAVHPVNALDEYATESDGFRKACFDVMKQYMRVWSGRDAGAVVWPNATPRFVEMASTLGVEVRTS
jgi:hypothetical protein